MAGKLTVKRVGVFLPALCLALVLLFVGLAVWLSVVGFPDALVRSLLRKAADEGVYLKVEKLKLAPLSGLALKATGVELRESPEAERPLASIRKLKAGLNISRLFEGKIRPGKISVAGGRVSLPVTRPEGKFLEVSDLRLTILPENDRVFGLNEGSLMVQGIPVRVQAHFSVPEFSDREDQARKPLNLRELLAPQQEFINEAYFQIARQQWSAEEAPRLQLSVDTTSDDVRASVALDVPRLDIKQFHVRRAELRARLENNVLTIHTLKFRTEEPSASVSLQGGYNARTNRISFNLKSTAALVSMLQAVCGKETPPLLALLSHPRDMPPEIGLEGDISLAKTSTDESHETPPDGTLAAASQYALQQAVVRGRISQKKLSVGSTLVDDAQLSFYYNNGDFSVDDLLLAFPEGEIRASASSSKGTGRAHVRMDMPVERLNVLISELSGQDVALPEGLSLDGNVKAQLHVRLTSPPFFPHETSSLEKFIPNVQDVRIEASAHSMRYGEYAFNEPMLSVQMRDIRSREDGLPSSVGEILLGLQANKADAEVQAEDVEGHLLLRNVVLPQDLAALDRYEIGELSLNAKCNAVAWEDVKAEHVQAELNEAGGIRLSQPWEACFSEITGNIRANTVRQGEHCFEGVSLEACANKRGEGSFAFRADEEDILCADLNWALPEELHLTNVKLNLPLSRYQGILRDAGLSTEALEWPEEVFLSAEASLDTSRRKADESFLCRLKQADVQLSIPRLVRTPYRVAPFRGTKEAISLDLRGSLRGNASGDILYAADLEAQHASGSLQLRLDGNSGSFMHCTGASSIRVDVMDRLIDSVDAHEIMRDFHCGNNTRTEVSGIDTTVRYDKGLQVSSTCQAQLHNIDYLLGSLVPEKDGSGKLTGKESLRKDLGDNPYTRAYEASCRVDVLVRQNTDGAPNETRISLLHPYLRFDNEPWLRRQGFKTGVRETVMGGDAVVIDVERSFVEIQNIRGTVYPAYSIGMFYPELQHFMSDVILPLPAQVSTPGCVFPIYEDCKRPMSGVIRAIGRGEAGFRFLGTTIPLLDFSGFISLSDSTVRLDRMNARSWGGVLDAIVDIDFAGKRTGFDGYVKASNMNLKEIARSYDASLSDGLCNAEVRFRASSPEVSDVQGYGEISVKDANLLELSLFSPIGSLISDLPGNLSKLEQEAVRLSGQKPGFFSRIFSQITNTAGDTIDNVGEKVDDITNNVPFANHFLRYDLQEAFVRFNMSDGHLRSDSMKAKGYNLNVGINLDINLDTLELNGTMWPKLSSVPTLVIYPLTFLSNYVVNMVIYGKVDDIKWRFALDSPTNSRDHAGKTFVGEPRKAVRAKRVPTSKRARP